MTWFQDRLYDHWRQGFEVTRELYRSQGGVQEIVLFETPAFGRVLALDGVVQVTTNDEFIYHEMLAHPPIYAHGDIRSVCIVGGGDGGMLREILKHRSVTSAVLVEIDGSVVEFCRVHLPTVANGAFDDPRTEIVIADGVHYMARTDRKFDLIVIDSTDPIGPGEALFTEEFYRDCARCLTDEGVLVNQNGVPFLQGAEVTNSYRRRKGHFVDVGFYVAAVPTYVGGFMALGWASRSLRPRAESPAVIHGRYEAAPVATRYYTPEIHQAAFALPKYIHDLFSD